MEEKMKKVIYGPGDDNYGREPDRFKNMKTEIKPETVMSKLKTLRINKNRYGGKQMKPHQKFELIPVSERLPDKEGDYYLVNSLKGFRDKITHFNPKNLKYDRIEFENYEFWLEEIPEQPEPSRKTADEIIKELSRGNKCFFTSNESEIVILAMHEYHNQFQPVPIGKTAEVFLEDYQYMECEFEYSEKTYFNKDDVIKLLHLFSAQRPAPSDADIEKDLLDALEHMCYNAAVIQIVAKSKGSLLEESYHIALETIDRAKAVRDNEIYVKPKK